MLTIECLNILKGTVTIVAGKVELQALHTGDESLYW